MGSEKQLNDAFVVELPQHRLYLPAYSIARTPVTNMQYKLFVDAAGYPMPPHWWGGKFSQGKEEHPVVKVSWRDAIAFCQWAKVRLPSEAEWEKAARGTDGRICPWGNQMPDKTRCNFDDNVDNTTPVGSYSDGASPYGVLDMAGNVWEWTSSKYQHYPYKADDGREEPTGDDPRTLRGGAFINLENFVRCALRLDFFPTYGYSTVGFRVVSPGG